MSDERENRLDRFLIAIDSSQMVEALSSVVLEFDKEAKLYLCFPMARNKRGDLHLLLEAKEMLDVFKQASLISKIQEKLNYDHTLEDGAQVVLHQQVLFKKNRSEEIYQDRILLSKENCQNGNIRKFLRQCYPDLIQGANVTSGRGGDLKENILAALRSNASVWEQLTQSPDSWDDIQQEIKAEIKKDSPTSKGEQATLVK